MLSSSILFSLKLACFLASTHVRIFSVQILRLRTMMDKLGWLFDKLDAIDPVIKKSKKNGHWYKRTSFVPKYCYRINTSLQNKKSIGNGYLK